MAATISIKDYELPVETHNLYDVTLDTDQIHTLLTHTPSLVDEWISQTRHLLLQHPTPIVVGLDVEWRPNLNPQMDNPIAILQLSTAHRCLIYQIKHSPTIPDSLTHFLLDKGFTFVGVGIEGDVERLVGDYGLSVGNRVDLCRAAAEKMGAAGLRNAGLKELAKEVLGKEVVKPKRVTMSRWDNSWLTPGQVQYACLDAFLSCEIGRVLNVGGIGA